MKLKIIIIILLIGVVAGCVDSVPAVEEKPNGNFTILETQYVKGYDLTVIHDDVRGITCYAYHVYRGVGISCLKDSDLS